MVTLSQTIRLLTNPSTEPTETSIVCTAVSPACCSGCRMDAIDGNEALIRDAGTLPHDRSFPRRRCLSVQSSLSPQLASLARIFIALIAVKFYCTLNAAARYCSVATHVVYTLIVNWTVSVSTQLQTLIYTTVCSSIRLLCR